MKDCNQGAKQLTIIGTTIGSPYYMSPEQAQGLDTMDHRTDIWALSVMAYECLTGTVPFQGNNGPSVLLEILRRQPTPASQVAPGSRAMPNAVDRVLLHGLEKAPEARLASAHALADELGWAYGLVGNFTEWAYVPESLLGARIAARLPLGVEKTNGRDWSSGQKSEALFSSVGAWRFRPSRTKLWLTMATLVVVGGILGAIWLKGFS